jgi:hypothetical protein
MASTLTEVDTYTATVTVPDDGDTRNASSVVAGFQDIADRTKNLDRRSMMGETELVVPGGLFVPHDVSVTTDYVRSSSGVAGHHWLQNSTTASLLLAPLPHLRSGTITAITLYLEGSVGHGGLPATMPEFYLISAPLTDGSAPVTEVTAQVDASGSVGAYEVPHTIDATGLSVTIDPLNSYWVSMLGEASTNSQTGLAFYNLRLTITA